MNFVCLQRIMYVIQLADSLSLFAPVLCRYLDGRRIGRADEVLREGGRVSFGGSELIAKNGEPHRNPFAYLVSDVSQLLDTARAANCAPAQELPPTQVAQGAEQAQAQPSGVAGSQLQQPTPAAASNPEASSAASHGAENAPAQPPAGPVTAATAMPGGRTSADVPEHAPVATSAELYEADPNEANQQTMTGAALAQRGNVATVISLSSPVAMEGIQATSQSQHLRQQQSQGLVDLTDVQELLSPVGPATVIVDLTKV